MLPGSAIFGNDTASISSGRGNPVSAPFAQSRSSSSLTVPYEGTAVSSPIYGSVTSYETNSARLSPPFAAGRSHPGTHSSVPFSTGRPSDSRHFSAGNHLPLNSYSRSVNLSEPMVSPNNPYGTSNISTFKSQAYRTEGDYRQGLDFQERQRYQASNMSSYSTTNSYDHHRDYKATYVQEGASLNAPTLTSTYGSRPADSPYHQTISGISGGLFGSTGTGNLQDPYFDRGFSVPNEESRAFSTSRNQINVQEAMGNAYPGNPSHDDPSSFSNQSNSRNINQDRSFNSSTYFNRDPFSQY